jgi:hypothetical protein
MPLINDVQNQLGAQLTQQGSPGATDYMAQLAQIEAQRKAAANPLNFLTHGAELAGTALGGAGAAGAIGLGGAGAGAASLDAGATGTSDPNDPFFGLGGSGPSTTSTDPYGDWFGQSKGGTDSSGGSGPGGIAGFLNNPQVKAILGLGGAGLGLAGQLQQRSNVNDLMNLGKGAFNLAQGAYQEKAPIRSAAYGNLGSMLAANANGPSDIFNQYFRTHPPSGPAVGGSPAPETGASPSAGPMASVGPAAALPGANGNAMGNLGAMLKPPSLGPSSPGPSVPYPGTPTGGLSPFQKLGAGTGVMY